MVVTSRPGDSEVVRAVADRVVALMAGYRPPDFAEVSGPDAALFLCAIDHRTGYRGRYLVGGRGPYSGSMLLWQLGNRAEQRFPGTLTAGRLTEVSGDGVAEIFRVGGETVTGAEVRAALWRDLAAGLLRAYEGSTEALLSSAEGMLGGPGGLIERLARFEAYADPLRKKGYLFAKVAARHGWLKVEDPRHWQVCSDSVLMRLALRSGLVHPGPVEEVRAATRDALGRVAEEAGVSPPVLDDLLWERGGEDPDLLGTAGGEVAEPARPDGTVWY